MRNQLDGKSMLNNGFFIASNRLVVALVLFAAGILATESAKAQEATPGDIDRFVADVMKEFDVPGVGLTIVKDGDVLLSRGYGVRSLDAANASTNHVDSHTLFGIASNTKAFTATALGLLVEAGLIEWDKPVIDYLPDFRMSDPYVTSEMTIRDLLVHRSGLGLGAGDLMWWPPSDYNRKDIVYRLRYLPLSTSFRNAYAYDNVLYSVAGEVIESVSGMSWEEFVQSRILDEIGMTDSNVLHSAAGEGSNTAEPHAPIDGKVRRIAAFKSDNTNPAGGINASASDIARWLVVQLDSGRVAPDKRLFSPSTTRELWTLVTPIPAGDPPPYLAALKTNFNGYALGFRVLDYRGRKLVTHTGGLPGYVSRIAMIPELKLGIAVFTNQESGDAFNAITHHVLDYYLGYSDTDWLAAYKRLRGERASRIASAENDVARSAAANSGPSLTLKEYAGTYRDPWYGDVVVEAANGRLRIRFTHTPSLIGTLQHHGADTFVARWDDRELRADAFITFVLDPSGSVRSATMEPASPTVDFSYDFQDLALTRVADQAD